MPYLTTNLLYIISAMLYTGLALTSGLYLEFLSYYLGS